MAEALVSLSSDPGSPALDRTLEAFVEEFPPAARLPAAQIVERTSWSCHHGVLRWSGECPDAADGRWKGPLRAALERLAAALDSVAATLVADFMDPASFWLARDQYVDVLYGAEAGPDFARRWLPRGGEPQRDQLLELLTAERWRLAMFASDGWFWDDPVRVETKQILLCAARSARIVDAAAGTALEARLIGDLSLFTSPSRRIDGSAIYVEALEEAGQTR